MARRLKRKPEPGEDPFAFSRRTDRDLRAAKWSPGRKVDGSVYERVYQEEDVPLLPASRDFLSRYGSLIIPYADQAGNRDVLEFCADDAVRGMGSGGLRQVERLLGVRPLCPIGHYQFGTCMLLQDETGRVLGVSDDTTSFLGASGEEAIENILSGRAPRIIRSEFLHENQGLKGSK
jgi:SUKH-3 immunity protein